eukprot:365558-Chlamydomonas_euryale.AAC.19
MEGCSGACDGLQKRAGALGSERGTGVWESTKTREQVAGAKTVAAPDEASEYFGGLGSDKGMEGYRQRWEQVTGIKQAGEGD